MYREGLIGLAVASAVALSGCQKMNTEGRIRAYEPNASFPNGTSARHPVEGTIPRGKIVGNEPFTRGTQDGQLIRDIPVPITMKLLKRGQERYEIYCSPCHSVVGDGDGIVVRRGFTSPPSFHIDRLRSAPAGHFFGVITQGYGAMFSYADRIRISDRWAIIAYIRALQKSQHVRYSELPLELRRRLDQAENPEREAH